VDHGIDAGADARAGTFLGELPTPGIQRGDELLDVDLSLTAAGVAVPVAGSTGRCPTTGASSDTKSGTTTSTRTRCSRPVRLHPRQLRCRPERVPPPVVERGPEHPARSVTGPTTARTSDDAPWTWAPSYGVTSRESARSASGGADQRLVARAWQPVQAGKKGARCATRKRRLTCGGRGWRRGDLNP
jgi:hypothetical protein